MSSRPSYVWSPVRRCGTCREDRPGRTTASGRAWRCSACGSITILPTGGAR